MKTLLLIAVGGALLGCTEEAGVKLRRECASVTDEVLKGDDTVPTYPLVEELKTYGIEVPPVAPMRPPSGTSDPIEWLKGDTPRYKEAYRKYQEEQREYDAKWDAARQSPNFEKAWNTARTAKRDEMVKTCIVTRAAEMGVR